MFLVDFNQVTISNIFADLNLKTEISEDRIRDMVLRSLRSYEKKFQGEYGEMVICCDSPHYWRKDYFKYYKSNRKNDRDQIGINWDFVFKTINAIKKELIEYFPYKVIEVYGTEADDVIAVLANTFHTSEPIMIVSGDKDFKQLQRKRDPLNRSYQVNQYAPIQKEFVVCDNSSYLQEQIIRGDRGDGIPNILSPDDCIYTGTRQNNVSKKFLEQCVKGSIPEHCKERYERNSTLIDFNKIPTKYVEAIKSEFSKPPKEKRNLMEYFIEHRISQTGDL